MKPNDFPQIFTSLTGSPPFPWQTSLFEKFVAGEIPTSAAIPTGLGKTSIIAVWICALTTKPDSTPRRLVYVVNRRTVVDQTTAEVERLCESLKQRTDLSEIRNSLLSLCALPLPSDDPQPLAISTLRGQFADNGAWCIDPARPAVVVGTVDMIGSGLLFSRYNRGFKTRPLHAGFLAQDSILVHDEAHLEPAFQTLLEGIVDSQAANAELRKMHVIALTATNRIATTNKITAFTLTDADRENETVRKRIHASKQLSLHSLGETDTLAAKLTDLAKARPAGRAVLVFTRSVATALKIAVELNKGDHGGSVAALTGTMRGRERDSQVSENPVFQRFLPDKDRSRNIEPRAGKVYLVATSAGEVGVNLSADDLVCDLSTYESMAQRFGRVNRFGFCADSEISVVHETEFDSAKPIEAARERTLALLRQLAGCASPAALDMLPADARAAAFSPAPKVRSVSDIQFDAWALTSIREQIAARPPVAPYLHGETEWQPPETHLAWRDDNDFAHIAADAIEGFLEAFPLKPKELLRDTTDRVFATLGVLVASCQQRNISLPEAWLIDEFGKVNTLPLAPFAISAKPKKDRSYDEESEVNRLKEVIAGATLLLPVSIGGLDPMGMFSSSAMIPASDSSGIERLISLTPDNGADISLIISDESAEEPRYLLWFAPTHETAIKSRNAAAAPETLDSHTTAVTANAAAIGAKLFPNPPPVGAPDLNRCLVAAARLHDVGKSRAQWQRNLGNLDYDPDNPATIFAKSGGKMRPRKIAEYYRHEFGSLLDAEHHPDFLELNETEREITLHLVATHHGRARPYFPVEESFDYSGNSSAAVVAAETPLRFARLQQCFGRWGLAWLESLLRAADYAASTGIVAPPASPLRDRLPICALTSRGLNLPAPIPTATLEVNPANPGHYFACCGLFELAARPRLYPGTVAWFEQTKVGFFFHLAHTPPISKLVEKITAVEITALDPNDATASPIIIGDPFELRIDWWKTSGATTSALKIWAGRMEVPRIACGMQKAIQPKDGEKNLFSLRIAYEQMDPTKKVEPFYFDANRGPNSDARDVGFSINDLGLETLAAPAVEFLTLVGLQRAIPEPSGDRLFDYHLWQTPIPIALLAAAINGYTDSRPQPSFRFESWYRTSQRKHKAFLPAKPL